MPAKLNFSKLVEKFNIIYDNKYDYSKSDYGIYLRSLILENNKFLPKNL